MEIKELIKNKTSEIEDRVIEIRRQIHANPELGFEEIDTARLIVEILEDNGIPCITGIAGTGVIGIIKGCKTSPTVALRADMDALAIEEKNQTDYASKNKGKMHACGHDAHIAILIGTAIVLNSYKDKLEGQVKLIFQPAEEGPGGAEPMISEGVLDNPSVDTIFGLHVWTDIEAGFVGLKDGPFFASVDDFDLIIKGSSCHGATPEQGIDAVVIAANVVNALQTIVSRGIRPTEDVVLTIGRIEGGYGRNIIADQVRLKGTIRCFDPGIRDLIEDKVIKIVSGICDGYGGNYELEYNRMYPALINDKEMNDILRSVSIEIIGTDKVLEVERPTLGGEDFAFFLEKVPGSFFLLGAGNEKKGITAPHHNPYFDIDEGILSMGIEILSCTVVAYLEQRA